jgi:hypothetical protein
MAAGTPSADDLISQMHGMSPAGQPPQPQGPSGSDLITQMQAIAPPSTPQPATAKSDPLATVLASPAATSADLPAGTAPPSSSDFAKSLQPAPHTTYGDVLPLAQDDTTGKLRLALPNFLRDPLIGLFTQGPQIDPKTGNLTVPGVTTDPVTGRSGLTPEAASVASLAANPLRFSGANPLMREPVSPLTLTRPPPVTVPELHAAIARADAAPALPSSGPPPADAAPAGAPQPSGAAAPAPSGAAPPSGGGPVPGGGAPRAVGADVTPPRLAQITPAEETAYRNTAEGTKLLENQTPGVPDTSQYVPGVTPNQAELEQTVNAAREIKILGIGNTEASQKAKVAANVNNEARTEYWNDTVGSPVDKHLEEQARERDINAAKPQVFSADNVTGPFDPTPVVQRIDDIMSQPANLENSQLKAVLPAIRARLVDANGNALITDPQQAWGLRQDIDRMTSARMTQADPNPHYVAHELNTVADAIDGKIGDVAPGYQDMLDQYAAHSRKLDEMQVLQDAAPGLFRGPNMQMGFNDFQRFMKGVVDARSSPSTDLNPYKSITDDTMQRLWNLRDDLRRSAGALDLARAPGSDTAPNIIDALKQYAKLGGQGVAENAISYLFPIGGPMITRGLRAVLQPMTEGRATARQTARMQQMLYPQNQLTAPPAANQLTSGGPP